MRLESNFYSYFRAKLLSGGYGKHPNIALRVKAVILSSINPYLLASLIAIVFWKCK